ncbi:hypothetical protein ACER0C_005086 [Sarotherodon galilaeus]
MRFAISYDRAQEGGQTPYRCAPVCSLLSSSRQQADRRAVRLGSCAPAVHAWHERSRIQPLSQDRVHVSYSKCTEYETYLTGYNSRVQGR